MNSSEKLLFIFEATHETADGIVLDINLMFATKAFSHIICCESKFLVLTARPTVAWMAITPTEDPVAENNQDSVKLLCACNAIDLSFVEKFDSAVVPTIDFYSEMTQELSVS